MKRFKLVATGGTFDVIHDGHLSLLSESFAISRKVIIGLTGDVLAARMKKQPLHSYQERLGALERVIESEFPGCAYTISELGDRFGSAVLESGVEALVVSEETRGYGTELNQLRAERGLEEVTVIVVPMVLADDGARISTTRIRDSEIDGHGHLP